MNATGQKKGEEKIMPLKNIYEGKFIVFEGIDGSGKTTISKMTADFLRAEGYAVCETFEPTKESPESRRIRRILEGEEKSEGNLLQELFIADRAYHIVKTVVPALGQGKIVVCDRYFFSTFAYGMAQGLEKEWLLKKHREIVGDNWILPDATIIVDASPKITAKRMIDAGRKKSIFEKDLKFAATTRENYLELAKDFENVYVINGDLPQNDVFGVVKRIILKILKK